MANVANHPRSRNSELSHRNDVPELHHGDRLTIDWFILRGDKFRRMPLDKDGIIRSKVFPGLWLDPQALIDGDLQKVLRLVQEGVQSDEHRKFVERLTEKKAKR